MRQANIYRLFSLVHLCSLIMISAGLDHGSWESISTSTSRQRKQEDLKVASFSILKAKCNVCHVKQHPRKVFTLDNMEELAPKIYKQVFVKKRMPKGKNITLTQEERQTLKQWIQS